jgi:hypothetical protein
MCPSHYSRWRKGADPALHEVSDRWMKAKRAQQAASRADRATQRLAAKAITNPARTPALDVAADADLDLVLSEILKPLKPIKNTS